MAGSLSAEQVDHYRETGHVGPVPALSAQEVAYYREKLEAFEDAQGMRIGRVPGDVRGKTHLLFTWMDELVRHPVVLDAVESLIGPNILLYHLTCWPKEPGEGAFVSWHQDGTYFHLAPFEQVTAWVALTEATPENGCMRILPSSHRDGQLEHYRGETKDNLLSNGQHVSMEIDDAQAITVPVPVGHVTFHNTHLVHCSGPNRTEGRRIGFGVSYIPTHVRYVGEGRLTASLMRGEDRHGHFDPEVAPTADFDDAARAYHAKVCANFFRSHGNQRAAADPELAGTAAQ